MFIGRASSHSIPNFNSIASPDNINHGIPRDEDTICINPPLFADAIACLHRNETNPQDLVNMLHHGNYMDSLWTGNKPNDWTLRSTFNNITANGMIREAIIPLLMYVSIYLVFLIFDHSNFEIFNYFVTLLVRANSFVSTVVVVVFWSSKIPK